MAYPFGTIVLALAALFSLLTAVTLAGLVPRQGALIVLAVVFGGLIGGRLVSLVLNGGVAGYGPTIRALYAIDAVGFALSLAALLSDSPV
jgi:hypothetical protein